MSEGFNKQVRVSMSPGFKPNLHLLLLPLLVLLLLLLFEQNSVLPPPVPPAKLGAGGLNGLAADGEQLTMAGGGGNGG